MSNLQWLLLIGAPVIVVLLWMLYKRHGGDLLQRLNDGRHASSRLVGRGQFIDGQRHIPVALALSQSAFFYENADVQGCLELHWIREVEYEDELTTGQRVAPQKVLRLRCLSQKFEFVLDPASVPAWKAALPPHRIEENQEAYAQ